jgi:hypothetical protein
MSAFDIDAMLSVAGPDVDATISAVPVAVPSVFTWDYSSKPGSPLPRLFAKATAAQWRSEDLPWEIEVDPERLEIPATRLEIETGTVLDTWDEERWHAFAVESRRWMLSQFLHGEQGALLCTAKLVENVPGYDEKIFGASQVIDEARHVQVFNRYLHEKLGGPYPINTHLFALLDDILADSRWDLTYLGMQIMVEGLALAAFGYMHALTTEPLLKQLLRQVMADEARHVAFGTLALREVYADLSAAELADRAEFAFEASVRMRDRLLQQEVWERFDVPLREVLPLIAQDPNRVGFQQLLFAKIVPNCAKLGLLDANGGWLRDRFEDLGVAHFEHIADEHDADILAA